MMVPKFRAVLEMAIENGLTVGLNRAYKHADEPEHSTIITHQYEAVMAELYEWFEFKDEPQSS